MEIAVVDRVAPPDDGWVWPDDGWAPPADPRDVAMADPVGRLAADLRTVDAWFAEVIGQLQQLLADGWTARRLGVRLTDALALDGRASHADAATLVRVAGMLTDLPATHHAFQHGRLSWGQIRAICAMARRLRADHRRDFDTLVADLAGRMRHAPPTT